MPILIKAKGYSVGTRRKRKGGIYEKQSDGRWKLVPKKKNVKSSKQESKNAQETLKKLADTYNEINEEIGEYYKDKDNWTVFDKERVEELIDDRDFIAGKIRRVKKHLLSKEKSTKKETKKKTKNELELDNLEKKYKRYEKKYEKIQDKLISLENEGYGSGDPIYEKWVDKDIEATTEGSMLRRDMAILKNKMNKKSGR